MATVRKSKARSRRSFVKAAVAAPLVAGLAADVQGEPLGKNFPKPKPEDNPGENLPKVSAPPSRWRVDIICDSTSSRRTCQEYATKDRADALADWFGRSGNLRAEVVEVPCDVHSFDPVAVYLATITSPDGCRVVLVSLDESEIERFVATFGRMNAGGRSRAEAVRVLVGPQGPSVEAFATIIDRANGSCEVCSVSTEVGFAEAFASTWNYLSGKHKHDSQARVVRGVATFAGAVA